MRHILIFEYATPVSKTQMIHVLATASSGSFRHLHEQSQIQFSSLGRGHKQTPDGSYKAISPIQQQQGSKANIRAISRALTSDRGVNNTIAGTDGIFNKSEPILVLCQLVIPSTRR